MSRIALTLLFSIIVYRHTSVSTQRKVREVNTRLAMMGSSNKWMLIDTDNIDDTCLTSYGVHLNGIGDERLTMNICNGVKDLCH